MATNYFAFELGDTLSGLIREHRAPDNYTLERVDRAGDWVDDPALIRHFVDPGDSELVPITTGEAQQLASAYGVEL